MDVSLEQPTRKLAPLIVAAPTPATLPSGLGSLSAADVLKRLQTVFPSLRRHLNSAFPNFFQEVISPRERMKSLQFVKSIGRHSLLPQVFAYLTLPTPFLVFKELLSAFSSAEGANELAADLLPRPATGSLEHNFCGTYSYLDSLHDAASGSSLPVAAQLVMDLKALVDCAKARDNEPADERRRRASFVRVAGFLPLMQAHLSVSAGRVLTHDWDASEPWKSKGDMLQQLLAPHVHQVPTKGSKINLGVEGYPSLFHSTFLLWYRELHEEVLSLFEEVGQKRRPVATKVPAAKRSMEKFIFCVKALLHGASHGSAFWMGNLKHKDLQGREVASQMYPEDEEDEEEDELQEDENADEEVALAEEDAKSEVSLVFSSIESSVT